MRIHHATRPTETAPLWIAAMRERQSPSRWAIWPIRGRFPVLYDARSPAVGHLCEDVPIYAFPPGRRTYYPSVEGRSLRISPLLAALYSLSCISILHHILSSSSIGSQ
jgi:hypothetical protein